MSSPADQQQETDENKKILFRFCSECSNLLFPREDKAESKLLFACRTCSFSEEAPSACVMRNEIASSAGDTAGVTSDIGQDPTLPRIKDRACPSCGEQDIVYFQSQQRTTHTGMKLYYVCTQCSHVWQ
ncbi:hypothetical protein DPSP01_003575 [Paraphaeosphaeria sporulosa]|uniref:DNA-directed RNA polymerase subunit n=1 Tax=Paraphaeosphaeria sporulosa TaxID=1460663 RepID=A0A177BWD2_9PLEO|nr:uncharacterized protein CC84DRAFT_1169535 [Paraphaeosphaeria sporulosa]OAF99435.1 hypothetical protein CC84DRAFT_1169535 [Paraphaeosphaeria sporulosa]